MVVRLVFARRVPRAWNKKILWATKGVVGMQMQLWQHVNLMWRYAKSASLKNPHVGTIITITTKTEHETPFSDIEFFIVDISNDIDKAVEDNEFEVCKKMFSPYGVFKKFFDKKVPESEFYKKPFNSKFFNIDAVLQTVNKQKKKGEKELEGTDKTVLDLLLKMGIMCHLGQYP